MELAQKVPLDEISEKSCEHAKDFGPIVLNGGQKVSLVESSEEFETGSCPVTNQITRANLKKEYKLQL